MRAASLWKNSSWDSRLCCYLPLISKCLWDHVLYLARFQVASICVIFAHSQTSHVMYHVTFFDLSNNHMTSHMINPNTWLPTLAFPLWNTDTITTLGWLPNWDVGSTSYLGNTPIWKLQNQDDWKTQWPDRDRNDMYQWHRSCPSCQDLLLFIVAVTQRQYTWGGGNGKETKIGNVESEESKEELSL